MKHFFYLLALVTLCQSSLKAQDSPAKIGFVDTDRVIMQLPDTKQLQETLKSSQAKLETDYAAKQQVFQKQYADFAAAVNTMHDTTRARMEGKLQQMSGELQQFEQDAQQTLENTRKLYMAPIYLKVGKAIDEVAAENGFALVIPRSIGGTPFLLYADEKRNITTLVLQKLGVTEAENKTPVAPPAKKSN
jgi:outer membrane protein